MPQPKPGVNFKQVKGNIGLATKIKQGGQNIQFIASDDDDDLINDKEDQVVEKQPNSQPKKFHIRKKFDDLSDDDDIDLFNI